MRINQIQNLCWLGNVVVFAGMGFVVVEFVDALKSRGQVPEVEWPDSGADAEVARPWPPPLDDFKKTWDTYVNGKVPPPPPPPEPPKPPDWDRDFKKNFEYLGGIEFLGEPSRSTVLYTYRKGKAAAISPGGMVDVAQLTSFRKVEGEGDKPAEHVLTFWNPSEKESLEMRLPPPRNNLIGPADVKPFERDPPAADDLVQLGVVGKDKLDRQSYLDPLTDEWVVPDQEQAWWRHFGEEVLERTALKPHVDAQGTSHGLKFITRPGEGTVLKHSFDIQQNDILKSVNGVVVTSKADLLDYLRTAGRDVNRFELIVETAGKERTVVIRRPSPRRAKPSRD